MKPLKLEMTAFGSYAESTVVPFDELQPGLCLITGDTGAGKTTIFDGIVFALYGTASGRDRSPEMMHSDLAEKSVDTVVELTFSQNGKRYTVRRSIHFPRKRTGEGGYGAASINALLTGEDFVPVEGATKVSVACEALLGLNAEQFRKIVMLAQGEFRDFLKADSEKKNEILSKLFDSSAYLWYQRLLDGARQSLEAERRGDREALRQALETGLVLPEGTDPARFLPDEPGLLDNLDALLNEVRSEQERMTTRQRAAEKERDGLLVRQTEGKALNEALERLAVGQALLAQMEAQIPEIDRRRNAMDRAELALYKALPAIREAERSAGDRDAARESLVKLEQEAVFKEEAYAQAQEARSGDDKLTERKDQIAGLLGETDRQLELFAALAEAEKSRNAAEAACSACTAQLERLRQSLQDTERCQTEQAERLAGLEDADLMAEQARREAAEAEKILDGLAGTDGARLRFQALTDRAEKLAEQEQQYRQFVQSLLAAQAEYNGLYRGFLAGQAGLLAGELRQAIEADGFGLCPVCGSRLDRSQAAHLAKAGPDTPDQETVDAAKARAEELERKRQSARETLDRAHSQHEARQEALLKDVQSLCPDCESWDALSAPGWLERAEASARTRSLSAQKALAAAGARVQTKNELLRARTETERRVKELRAALETARGTMTQRESAFAAAERECAVLRDRLRWPDESSAREYRMKLKTENAQVCNLLKAHESRERQAKESLDQVNGQLRHARETLEAQTAAAAAAEAAKLAALKETGFADAAAVSSALLPARELDPEAWLKQERKALADWDQRRKSLTDSVRDLAERTAGREQADLAALEAAFAEAEAACRELRQDCRVRERWLEDCGKVRAQAGQRLAALASTDAAWTALDRLGSLAAGSTGQGGKLSFERYVMGAVFREILEQANRRLDVISGGRYQLEHKTAADRASAKAGLEIEILDLSTGKRRPSASLSGGEAFYTSLALALGLSDVVQSRAGGMKLEALFIDEGFGSLDEDMLDNALAVFNALTGGDRLVGIISHVDKLSASIPQKIIVKNGPKGSSLKIVV